MLYTRDSSLWREEGPKALLEFLLTAEGEQHDAAVYDTKCEFDRYDPDAIRYIACLAMTKAAFGKEEFSYELPANGTVVSLGAPIGTEDMLKSAAYRAEREKTASEAADPNKYDNIIDRNFTFYHITTYIPDASNYVERVIDAISKRRISVDDMTPAEKSNYETQNKRIGRLHLFLLRIGDLCYIIWETLRPVIIILVAVSLITLLVELSR